MQPPAPHRVAKPVVPLEPARRETAQLIPAGAEIPGFGDQLHTGQHRVLGDGLEKCAAGIEAVLGTAQHAGQVEPEPVDMHVVHPVTQAVHHELQHARLTQIQRIAATGVIDVGIGALVRQPVPRCVVQPPPAQRRPGLVGLAGVIEDDIEDHFDAGPVQGSHHGPKLIAHGARVGRRRITGLRAKEAERVVAPVIDEPPVRQVPLVQVLVHRQQADRGDAEPLQMRQDRRVGKAGIGAAHRFGNAGMQAGEALDMQFVQHGLGRRALGRCIVDPVGVVIDHPGLQRMGRVVARIGPRRFVRIGAQVIVAPLEAADDFARPRVEQQLVRIEAMAMVGPPWTLCPQSVDQSRSGPGQVAVPDVAGVAGQRDPLQFMFAPRVEQAQFDALRVRREHGEVDAPAIPVGAQRPRPPLVQAGHRLRGGADHGIHSKNTVASGGRLIATDQRRPWLAASRARNSPNGVPTSLPP